MTKQYEAMMILKTAGTEQDVARHAAKLEEPIKKVGGQVAQNQAMGRRRLAFRIARQTEGYYYCVRFQAPAERIEELERQWRLNETVIRFMLLAADHAADSAPGGGRSTSASGAVAART